MRNIQEVPAPMLLAVAASLPVIAMACYCHARMPGALCLSPGGESSLLRQRISVGWLLIDPARFAQQSFVMTLAMAPALLYGPVRSLWVATAHGGRIRATLGFLIAYVAVWCPANLLLMITAFLLQVIVGGMRVELQVLSVLVAVAWNTTPAKRYCLAACGASVPQKTGAPALIGLQGGARQGLFCIGTCWLVMLVPLLSGERPVVPMGLVTFILALERNYAPRSTQYLIALQFVVSRFQRRHKTAIRATRCAAD